MRLLVAEKRKRQFLGEEDLMHTNAGTHAPVQDRGEGLPMTSDRGEGGSDEQHTVMKAPTARETMKDHHGSEVSPLMQTIKPRR